MIRFIFFALALTLASCSAALPNKKKTDEQMPVAAGPVVFPPLPEKMTFAGKEIVLTDEDVMERLDREVLMNAYYNSATTGYFKRAHRYFPMIEKILKEEGVPNDFKYLAIIESGLVQAISPVGAQGFWQFMPATAKIYDLEMSAEVDERLHIEKSTRAACQYLKNSQATLNDWIWTTASYNRGVGGVQQDMAWQGTDHYFDTDQNNETGRYFFRLLAIKLIFENPEAYGYYPDKMQLYEPIKTKSVTVSESIPNIAVWAIEQGVNFKIVQKLNPWLKGNKLTIRTKTYEILLPADDENLKPYKEYLR
jgi:membrane-bound lytic murein transglycosylase D